MLRDSFLVARPPLLAVMQGGEFATHNSFTSCAQTCSSSVFEAECDCCRAVLRLNELTKCWGKTIPLLASPQGGVVASSNKCRVATEADATGVVFLFLSYLKTTPAARSADASR